jgi:hypothetical protein
MSVSYGGDSITFGDGSIVSSGSAGFKNKIINGHMMISQNAASSAITPTGSGAGIGNFAVDRFRVAYSQNSKLTAQQNKGSVSPPSGFKNYLGVSCSTTATVGVSDYFLVGQPIEGYNIADLDWGLSTAKTVTLSFWAYSNTTGTFGGSVNNSGYSRAYCFSYTINTANTWEYKTVTITGDTTGTWLTDTGVGAYVWFSLGSGSTVSKAAGSWGAGEYYGVTGANNLMGSTSNYLYITGVQLEKGTTASSFEFRSYGKELMLCQRYYQRWENSTGGTTDSLGTGTVWTSTNFFCVLQYIVPMRALPTGLYSNTTAMTLLYSGLAKQTSAVVFQSQSKAATEVVGTSSSMSAGSAGFVRFTAAGDYLALSAEL